MTSFIIRHYAAIMHAFSSVIGGPGGAAAVPEEAVEPMLDPVIALHRKRLEEALAAALKRSVERKSRPDRASPSAAANPWAALAAASQGPFAPPRESAPRAEENDRLQEIMTRLEKIESRLPPAAE